MRLRTDCTEQSRTWFSELTEERCVSEIRSLGKPIKNPFKTGWVEVKLQAKKSFQHPRVGSFDQTRQPEITKKNLKFELGKSSIPPTTIIRGSWKLFFAWKLSWRSQILKELSRALLSQFISLTHCYSVNKTTFRRELECYMVRQIAVLNTLIHPSFVSKWSYVSLLM